MITRILSFFPVFAASAAMTTNRPAHWNIGGQSFSTNRPMALPQLIHGTLDSDARQFIFRAGLTSFREQYAINELVKSFKTNGCWTNLVAFYPFVGGNSNSCALNLVGTNYSIRWPGNGDIFNAGGVTGGSTNLAVIPFNPVIFGAPTNDWHMFIYVGTNLSGGSFLFGSDPTNHATSGNYLSAIQGNIWSIMTATNHHAAQFRSLPITGGILMERTNNTSTTVFHGKGSYTNWVAGPPVHYFTNYFLFKLGSDGYGSNVNLRAVSFGYSMNAPKASNYLDTIIRFQNHLGRLNH